MGNYRKRKRYTIANEFHRQILLPALTSNIILMLTVVIILFFFILELTAETAGFPRFFTVPQLKTVGSIVDIIVQPAVLAQITRVPERRIA